MLTKEQMQSRLRCEDSDADEALALQHRSFAAGLAGAVDDESEADDGSLEAIALEVDAMEADLGLDGQLWRVVKAARREGQKARISRAQAVPSAPAFVGEPAQAFVARIAAERDAARAEVPPPPAPHTPRQAKKPRAKKAPQATA